MGLMLLSSCRQAVAASPCAELCCHLHCKMCSTSSSALRLSTTSPASGLTMCEARLCQPLQTTSVPCKLHILRAICQVHASDLTFHLELAQAGQYFCTHPAARVKIILLLVKTAIATVILRRYSASHQ